MGAAGPGRDRSDDLWAFAVDGTAASSGAYDTSFSADNYFRPLVGKFARSVGSDSRDSQVLWYREQEPRARLLVQEGLFGGFDRDDQNETPLCGLSAGREYVPLVGNFDVDVGEEADEIFWLDQDGESHVMWWDLDSMWVNGQGCTNQNHGFFAFADAGNVKPFVGDFDRNGIDDIFWYSGGALPPDPNNPFDVGPQEIIWFMGDKVILQVQTLPRMIDAAPFVGDYNGDGCEDVLWYNPLAPNSPLWRANCSPSMPRGFTPQTDEQNPTGGGYPVGYLRTRGGR